jgi:hypothetical protein
MRKRWDDIEILRAINVRQEELGGPLGASGRDLMDEIHGPPRVTDSMLIGGFVHELHLARAASLLTFEIEPHAASRAPAAECCCPVSGKSALSH